VFCDYDKFNFLIMRYIYKIIIYKISILFFIFYFYKIKIARIYRKNIILYMDSMYSEHQGGGKYKVVKRKPNRKPSRLSLSKPKPILSRQRIYRKKLLASFGGFFAGLDGFANKDEEKNEKATPLTVEKTPTSAMDNTVFKSSMGGKLIRRRSSSPRRTGRTSSPRRTGRSSSPRRSLRRVRGGELEGGKKKKRRPHRVGGEEQDEQEGGKKKHRRPRRVGGEEQEGGKKKKRRPRRVGGEEQEGGKKKHRHPRRVGGEEQEGGAKRHPRRRSASPVRRR
jgi:hypothetical protein